MSSHDQQSGSSRGPAPSASASDQQFSGSKPPSLPKLNRMSISEQNPDLLAGNDTDQTKRRRVQETPTATSVAQLNEKYLYPKQKYVQPFPPTSHIPEIPPMLQNVMFNSPFMYPPALLHNPIYMQRHLSAASPQSSYRVSTPPQWTTDDAESSDNDVIVDEEMTNKNICFGMLQTEIVAIKTLNLVKDEQYEPVTVTSEGRRDAVNYSFNIKSRGATPKFLGWVPFDDTKVLGPLAERHMIWWDAFIPRGKVTSTRTPLYMILYCQPANIYAVAKTFQQHEKNLHTPPFFNPACRYQNLYLGKPQVDRSSSPSNVTAATRPRQALQHNETHIRHEIGRLLESIRQDSSRKDQNTVADDDQDGEEALDQDMYIKGLNIMLLPHQVRGIRWMLERESSESSAGGILADMGLGKTIQTIGLIASTMQSSGTRRVTLVVTPLALVRQWAREISAKTEPGTMKVLIYHGPNRSKDASTFSDYDVVVTTYQVVASDLPSSDKSSKNRSKIEDILKSETSSVCTEEESDTASATQTRGPLLQFDWYRVVLDEAQYIKNKSTRSAISCTELSAQKRWCLTGTPMQNNVDELYSLFRFLRIKPLCEYRTFKETISNPMQTGRMDTALERLKVVLMAVMLRRTKQMFKNGDSKNGSSAASSTTSSSAVSEADDTSSSSPSISTQLTLKLPPREKTDIILTFSPEEQRLYDLLSTRMRRTVKEILQAGKGTRNYMNMLCMILRLRQACDHPRLVLSTLKDSDDAIALATESGIGIKKASGDAASQQAFVEKLASGLGWQGAGMVGQSVFDKATIDSNAICDLCGRPVPFADSMGSFCTSCKEQINQCTSSALINQQSRLTSTKISKTLEILQDIRRETPGEKTVIFSQFTSMLDLLQETLRQHGIKFCRYDGSMPNYLREKSLVALQTDSECTVMLISLKCGSLGLNLTAANRVILLDIWWNPAVEEQAIDRVHRIGQTLPVQVVRLMIDNTIEEKIVKLQQKKAQMVQGALGDGIVRNTKLTMEEIRALFDL